MSPSTSRTAAPPLGAALTALLASLACRAADPTLHAGFVDDAQAQVAAQLPGRVEEILVREGDRVKKGQLLARLDAREAQARLEQAQAALAQARQALHQAEANLRAAEPGVAGAGADLARAQATLDEAEANHARVAALKQGDAASTRDLDAARARLMEARATLLSLTAGKRGAERRVGAQLAAAQAAQAQVGVAEAAVHLAEVQLAEGEIRRFVGVHESYLSTPLTRSDIAVGTLLSGTLVTLGSSGLVLVIGFLMTGSVVHGGLLVFAAVMVGLAMVTTKRTL
jgi:HlyD family secretion protein